MVNTIMLIFWGIYVAVVGYKVLRAVITYEINRHKDRNYSLKVSTSFA